MISPVVFCVFILCCICFTSGQSTTVGMLEYTVASSAYWEVPSGDNVYNYPGYVSGESELFNLGELTDGTLLAYGMGNAMLGKGAVLFLKRDNINGGMTLLHSIEGTFSQKIAQTAGMVERDGVNGFIFSSGQAFVLYDFNEDGSNTTSTLSFDSIDNMDNVLLTSYKQDLLIIARKDGTQTHLKVYDTSSNVTLNEITIDVLIKGIAYYNDTVYATNETTIFEIQLSDEHNLTQIIEYQVDVSSLNFGTLHVVPSGTPSLLIEHDDAQFNSFYWVELPIQGPVLYFNSETTFNSSQFFGICATSLSDSALICTRDGFFSLKLNGTIEEYQSTSTSSSEPTSTTSVETTSSSTMETTSEDSTAETTSTMKTSSEDITTKTTSTMKTSSTDTFTMETTSKDTTAETTSTLKPSSADSTETSSSTLETSMSSVSTVSWAAVVFCIALVSK